MLESGLKKPHDNGVRFGPVIDVVRIVLTVIGLIFITSCSDVNPKTESPPLATSQPTKTASATATEITIPESFATQKEILEDNGYAIRSNDAGLWAVYDQVGTNQVVYAKDVNTLVYTTQDGEDLKIPASGFKVQEVMGVDVKAILTFLNSSGKVELFYLNHIGNDGTQYRCWTSPIEGQTNPEVIENYTLIDLEDVWSGRLLFSELLSAEPFPEEAFVPSGFFYTLFDEGANTGNIVRGRRVNLDAYGIDSEGNWAYSHTLVSVANDFRRWIAFYKSVAPSGAEVIIGTQQIQYTDGTSFLLFHYVFGSEWSWDRTFVDFYSGVKKNIIDSLFLAKEIERGLYSGFDRGHYLVPNIFYEPDPGYETAPFKITLGKGGPPAAGSELYLLDKNNPLFIRTNLLSFIREGYEANPHIFLVDAEQEIVKLQDMMLLGEARYLRSDYFNAPR